MTRGPSGSTWKAKAAAKRADKEALRAKVLSLRATGLSFAEIGRRVQMEQSSVRKLVKLRMLTGIVSDSSRKGRPSRLSKRYKRGLLRMCRKHPFWSASKLADEMHNKMVKALADRPAGVCIFFS